MITAAIKNRLGLRGTLKAVAQLSSCCQLWLMSSLRRTRLPSPNRPCFLKQGGNQLNNLTKSLHSLKSRLYLYISIYLCICYLHINRYIHIHASINYILQRVLFPPPLYPWPTPLITSTEVTGGSSWEGEERQLVAPSPSPSYRHLLQVLHSTFVVMVSVS